MKYKGMKDGGMSVNFKPNTSALSASMTPFIANLFASKKRTHPRGSDNLENLYGRIAVMPFVIL
jgi:hypothetical protein